MFNDSPSVGGDQPTVKSGWEDVRSLESLGTAVNGHGVLQEPYRLLEGLRARAITESPTGNLKGIWRSHAASTPRIQMKNGLSQRMNLGRGLTSD